ncbi:B12-binding domain-containing radical SAM protein [Candidatus Woesearchaeota archaeon]|nr:B12-binding domain-containing radical SAM protein [Candidatus Woesearchaeota archaeon]
MTEKRKYDIALINVPGRLVPSFYKNLGLGYIQAFLKKKGMTSIEYLPKYRGTLDQITDDLKSIDTKIYGFNCCDTNYVRIKAIVRELKRKKKGIFCIAGGVGPTLYDRVIMDDCPEIDVCVRSEAESCIQELILAINDCDALSKINNITYRNGSKFVRNKDDSSIFTSKGIRGDLDYLDSPYLNGIYTDDCPGIITSKGCQYACIYCSFTPMWNFKISFFSVERVLAELEIIDKIFKKYPENKQTVKVFDNNFVALPQRAKEICKGIIDRGLDINLSCYCRFDNLDIELIDLMKTAGFCNISIGAESFNPKTLRRIKKVTCQKGFENLNIEMNYISKVEDTLKILKKKGFYTAVNIILGLPGDSFEEMQYSINKLFEIDTNFRSISYLRTLYGSRLYDKKDEYDIKIKKFDFTSPIIDIPKHDLNSLVYPEGQVSIHGIFDNNFDDLKMIFEGSADTDYLRVIYLQDFKSLDQKALISWLKRIANIATDIVVECDDKEDFEEFIRNLVKMETIVNNFYWVKKEMLAEGVFLYRLNFLLYDYYNPELKFMSVSPECKTSLSNIDTKSIHSVFIDLGNQNQLRAIKEEDYFEMKENILEKVEGAFEDNIFFFDDDYYFKNTETQKINRLLVCKDGIKASWNGKIIGSIGDNLANISGRYNG